uniref:ABC transporter domain-containing protein n=1 Tax=Stomoxys calcitrans TaxID=35570 RepID=A0A1I8P7J2_STOCA
MAFSRIPSDLGVHLKFADLTYRVKERKKIKTILNGVSGEFRAGELSVIVGASGCGKTTLLNLLAGYRITTTEGSVMINGTDRNMNAFSQLCRYILQDDCIIPCFTVLETMMFASNFKLEASCGRERRKQLILEILDSFNLRQQSNTRIDKISGGERKRVSIALEMLGHPLVLLLDEPLTGLDEFSASQCVRLLKNLAESGRTIICSLHCPSARLCEMFNMVYVMSRGECVYQGAVDKIVTYMEKFNLECPITHNPMDFVMDVTAGAYGELQQEMVQQIENGKCLQWFLPSLSREQESCENPMDECEKLESAQFISPRSVPWWLEYYWLYGRFMQQMCREKIDIKLRIIAHILCGLAVGFLFFEVTRNAKYAIFNYYLGAGLNVAIAVLAMGPMLATVPRDIRHLRREYFNQWYRLSSYFMAMMTSELLVLIPLSIVSAVILYFVTGQPMQLWRLLLFALVTAVVSLVASSFGLLLASSLKGMHALFVGPLILSIMIMIMNISAHTGDMSTAHKILIHISFMRYAVDASLSLLLGFNRPNFPCPSDSFCFLPMNKGKYILKLLGCSNISYSQSIAVLSGMAIIFSLLAFFVWKYRLSAKHVSKK